MLNNHVDYDLRRIARGVMPECLRLTDPVYEVAKAANHHSVSVKSQLRMCQSCC